jgi:hypothetical protein
MTTLTMPPLNLRWYVLGRPVKPVAAGLMLSMLAVAYWTASGRGELGPTAWAYVVAVVALAAAAALLVGWQRPSQRLAEYGLAAAFAVWVFRAVAVGLSGTVPFSGESLMLSLSVAVIAAGSYALEVADTLPASPERR